MEWFGIVALLLLLCYSAYPGKVKRLETKVKRLEKKQRGVAYMSNSLNSMAGIGICLGISFGISGSLIFSKKDKDK